MTNPNDPAFEKKTNIPGIGDVPISAGLTKREYFAAMALSAGNSAEWAVKYADALIAELNKTEKKNDADA